jgi:hypothetical protein
MHATTPYGVSVDLRSLYPVSLFCHAFNDPCGFVRHASEEIFKPRIKHYFML